MLHHWWIRQLLNWPDFSYSVVSRGTNESDRHDRERLLCKRALMLSPLCTSPNHQTGYSSAQLYIPSRLIVFVSDSRLVHCSTNRRTILYLWKSIFMSTCDMCSGCVIKHAHQGAVVATRRFSSNSVIDSGFLQLHILHRLGASCSQILFRAHAKYRWSTLRCS